MNRSARRRDQIKAETALSIIERCGRVDFEPVISLDFVATGAAPGSQEKIDVLVYRAENGFPLFHEHDRSNYAGLTGAIPPRTLSVRRQDE